MSKEAKNNVSPNKSSHIIIELDDNSGYFISYWNLAIKKHLANYFCTFNLDKYFSVKQPLNCFNISIFDINNTMTENKNPLIFEEKLFAIKIHYLSSEKNVNADFIQSLKQSYDNNKLNLVLYLINEIKDNTNILKESTKLLNKIKSKSGINDITIMPFNIVFFEKLMPAFPPFLQLFSERFNKEFFIKMEKVTKAIEKYEIDNKEENYDNYQFMENMICYFDLLSLLDKWDIIKNYCNKFLFKELNCFAKENSNMKPIPFSNFDLNKFKLNFKNKKICNTEFQEFIINYYIKSLQYLEEYKSIISFIKIIPYKMNLFMKNFKTEYHYIFWILNYYYGLIDYFNSLNNFPNSNATSEALVYLYSLEVKFLKLYAYKTKNIYIPDNKILIEILDCIKNRDFEKIGERMKKLMDKKEKVEENNDLKIFMDEFKDKDDKLFLILNDNKNFLEEILSLLNCINKNIQEYINLHISINCVFDIVYLLLFFCKFNEAKNILVPLLHYKFLKKQKIRYIYEYICFILILITNFIEKNYDNLNLIFKLLNINYSKISKIFQTLNCESNNIINEIISNYLDSFDSKKIEKEINFSLDTVLNLKFFNGEDKILFINKSKNKSQKLDYKITNNTGISLNINKINLIFEEKDINDISENKKNISYSIDSDKNGFKKLESFIKEKDEFFNIEFSDIFKLNNIYKLIEIQYELSNSIKGIYHIKENIELLFNELNLNIKTEIFSSYDNPCNKNNFYYNILCMVRINIMNISDISELENKSLLIQIIDANKNDDSILKKKFLKL